MSSDIEQGSAVSELGDGSGARQVDWAGSPFVGPSEQLSPVAFASVTSALPYGAVDPGAIPGPYVIYRMGDQIAFVGTDPIVCVIQSPTGSAATLGLDASDPTYRDAAGLGTEVWNITHPDVHVFDDELTITMRGLTPDEDV
ncbi:MAG: hypothetical protein GXP34_03115 [Actinobacteria bacterium]|nr:hypothetical protein [Actinomycetota bacterium]